MPQTRHVVRTLSCALLAAAALPAPGAIIYNCRAVPASGIFVIADNDESSSFVELPGLPQTREFESRVGDQITFAGTDRLVTNFTIRLTAFSGVPAGFNIAAELSIYESVAGLPGALLWSGVNPNVLIPGSPNIATAEASFAPNIVLPNTVCFAVGLPSIVRVGGESRTMGVTAHSAPSIGSSPVTTIHQLSADNSWFIENISDQFGGLFRNVDARVEAIPAPSSLAILAFIAAAVRRRR